MRNIRVTGGFVLVLVAIASVAFAALPPGGTFTDAAVFCGEAVVPTLSAWGIVSLVALLMGTLLVSMYLNHIPSAVR